MPLITRVLGKDGRVVYHFYLALRNGENSHMGFHAIILHHLLGPACPYQVKPPVAFQIQLQPSFGIYLFACLRLAQVFVSDYTGPFADLVLILPRFPGLVVLIQGLGQHQ